VTVRWTTLVAAVVAGRSGLEASVPLAAAAMLLSVFAASNLWLMWKIGAGRSRAIPGVAAALVSAGVLLLSWFLLGSGGVLNPASDEILAAFERPDGDGPGPTPPYQPMSLDRVEWEHISRVLIDCGGNVSEAARILGIHRRSLQRKLATYPARR
jgi:hypothetical protein